MAGLIETEFGIIQGCGCQHADRTSHHTRLIRQNITKHILCQNHIKLCRILHKLHGTVVHQHMLQRYIRIRCSHLLHHLTPESGRIQYIGLIHASHLFPAFPGDVKPLDGYSADFIFVISQGVNRFAYTILFNCFTLSEIQSSRQFPHDHHVKSCRRNFFLQRTGSCQFLI